MNTHEIFRVLILANLTPTEYLALTAIFLDNLSEEETALQLNEDLNLTLNRTKVHRLKTKALDSIKTTIGSGAS